MRLRKELEIGGRPVIVESGHLAKQADGSVTVRQGEELWKVDLSDGQKLLPGDPELIRLLEAVVSKR